MPADDRRPASQAPEHARFVSPQLFRFYRFNVAGAPKETVRGFTLEPGVTRQGHGHNLLATDVCSAAHQALS